MHPLLAAVVATLCVSALSLVGLAFMALGQSTRRSALFAMVAFAAGAMMAASFFHLLPEAAQQAGAFSAGVGVLAGFGCFFILERFLHWRHCHKGGACDVHPYTTLSLLGDALHNFLDGVVIGSAFLVGPALGVSTTLVIAAHELPQELGDFAILVHGGRSRRSALALNLLSSLTSVLGAVVAYAGLEGQREVVPHVMAFAAGSFIYISSSDLVPELHKEQDIRRAMVAFLFFVAAVALMAVFALHGDPAGHAHV